LLTLQKLHYLGGTEESFTLNFSRPGAQVIAQYYNVIHLGFEGYRGIMENALANARLLSKALESSGWYRCVSDIHRPKGQLEYKKGEIYEGREGETSADYNAGLPVVAIHSHRRVPREVPARQASQHLELAPREAVHHSK
jgi:glutamate decarboxylase